MKMKDLRNVCLRLAVLGVWMAGHVSADVYNCTAGGGAATSWTTTNNWDLAGYPIAGDTANFTGTLDRTVSIAVNSQTAAFVNVSGSGKWTFTGGNTLQVDSRFAYGSSNAAASLFDSTEPSSSEVRRITGSRMWGYP